MTICTKCHAPYPEDGPTCKCRQKGEPLRKQLDSEPLQRGDASKPLQGNQVEGEPLRK